MNGAEDGQVSLRRALLRGNVFWLSIVSLLNDTASEMIYPLVPYFLVSVIGASPLALGGIEGAAESASSLLKLTGGWISDRVRRRKPIVVAGYTIAACARPLVALIRAPAQLFAIRMADRVGKGIRNAPRDALLVESVPAAARGRAFGFNRAADHAGAVIGPLLATVLLFALSSTFDAPGGEERAYRLVFAAALIPGIATVLILLLFVRESPRAGPAAADLATAVDGSGTAGDASTSRTGGSAGPAAGGSRGRALPDVDSHPPSGAGGFTTGARVLHDTFARYLAVLFLFTLGNASDAFLLLRATELGVAPALAPMLWGVHHLSKVIWSVPGGALADRLGPRPAIIAGWFVYAATYAAFAVASDAWHAWALFVAYGLFYGLTEAPERALVAALAPAHRRGSAFGAYHAAIGIGALPASLLFGYLYVRAGAPVALLTGAALALVAALGLLLLVRPAQPVLSHASAGA